MITRYRISIDGTHLDSCLDDNKQYKKYKDKIVILDLKYSAPEFSRTIETAGEDDGGVITRSYRQKASVTVEFGLYIYDTADRFAVCEIIKSMVRGRFKVVTNDRNGEALYDCVCDQFPEIDSARDWTVPLTMTISSYSFPYWQEQQSAIKTLTGVKGSGKLDVRGNAPLAYPVIEIVAHDPFAVNKHTFTVTVGDTSITCYYPLAINNYVVIDNDQYNNLRARCYNTKSSMTLKGSMLPYITASSSDKLIATPGESNKISFSTTGNRNLTVTYGVRGTWL